MYLCTCVHVVWPCALGLELIYELSTTLTFRLHMYIALLAETASPEGLRACKIVSWSLPAFQLAVWIPHSEPLANVLCNIKCLDVSGRYVHRCLPPYPVLAVNII